MLTKPKTIRNLGNGLIMRRSSPEDADALSEFNAKIHGEEEASRKRLAAWTRDLLTRPHPTFNSDDFTIVEEATGGRIVSSLNLIPQTWSYEGIEFGVGRPELVGTLPKYRGKGLVRAQFNEIHKWCIERDLPVQVITGIPYFYRQFDYEMALEFAGRRYGYKAHIPKLKDDEKEKCHIRPAAQADASFINDLYALAIQRHMIGCVRDLGVIKYELEGRSRDNLTYFETHIIENEAGVSVGYLQHSAHLHGTTITSLWYELKNGASWLDVTPSVVRYLWDKGQEYAERDGKECNSFAFMGGAKHPVYQVMGDDLPHVHKPYAYYVRVANLAGFIRRIAPVLEERMASSIAPGYSGELKISFYKNGIRLLFENGKLVSVENWKPSSEDEGHVAFPDLTFIQVLFGYRSFTDLHQSFADCWWNNEKDHVLINILFPKKLSDVFPIA